MRAFVKFAPGLWHSKRFRGLASDDARLLHCYLLAGPHGNSAGLFHLPEGYATADLQWAAERFRRALQELCEADLVAHDAEHDLVLIRRWFAHSPPMNRNHATGIERELSRLPKSHLVQEALEAAATAWQAQPAGRAEHGGGPGPSARPAFRPRPG